MPKNKRDYEIEIEVTDRVAAFDEGPTREKTEKALAAPPAPTTWCPMLPDPRRWVLR